jgi:hypothetical protein
MVLAILSEQAREQAAEIAHWTKLGGDANKQEGRWPGGVNPYGLVCPRGTGKLVRNPDEYPTARRIADELLKGTTPSKIAEMLNSENITTRKGKRWRAQTIISMAHSPSWAGMIPNRERATDEFGNPLDKYFRGGEPLLNPQGHPIFCGEGVVTFAEREKILATFAARSRPGTAIGDKRRGKRKATTTMTGIFRCPRCKGPMGNGGLNYRCTARMLQGPSVCIGVATMRARVDTAMAAMWQAHILSLSPESDTIHAIARRWLSYQDPAKEARKAAVSAALDKAVTREMRLQKEFFIGGSLTESQYDALRAELSAQIAGLKSELAELSQGADLSPLMDPKALAALWEGAGIEGQRALLMAALESVTITLPKYHGDRTPITDRLIPVWRSKPRENASDAGLEAVERSRARRKAREAAAAA